MRLASLPVWTRWAITWGAAALISGAASRSSEAAALAPGTTYSTAARFSGVGLPIGFDGVSNQTVPASGPIELGRLNIKTPETGGNVTFDNAAFAIEFNAPTYHKVEASSDPTAALSKVQFDGVFAVEGRLNGVVSADGSSTVKATIDGVTTRGLNQTSLDRTYVDNLPFSVGDVKVAPEIDLTSGPGGLAGVVIAAQIVEDSAAAATPLIASTVSIQPVPEPSTFAVFLAAACGLAIHRRRRAGVA